MAWWTLIRTLLSDSTTVAEMSAEVFAGETVFFFVLLELLVVGIEWTFDRLGR